MRVVRHYYCWKIEARLGFRDHSSCSQSHRRLAIHGKVSDVSLMVVLADPLWCHSSDAIDLLHSLERVTHDLLQRDARAARIGRGQTHRTKHCYERYTVEFCVRTGSQESSMTWKKFERLSLSSNYLFAVCFFLLAFLIMIGKLMYHACA